MSGFILVCDDSMIARKQVAKALPSQWDKEVVYAKNGQEAFDLVASHDFELILLDLTMPVLDGLGFLAKIKEHNMNLQKVIVISADIQSSAQDRAFELGACAFLRKPVTAEVLASKLEELELL